MHVSGMTPGTLWFGSIALVGLLKMQCMSLGWRPALYVVAWVARGKGMKSQVEKRRFSSLLYSFFARD